MDKKEYLDKIVSFIVDDTVVDQDNRTWYPPFPTPQKDPTHKIFYNLIPMAEVLGPKSLMNNVYVQNFLTYCKDTYGVTLEERELRDLWLKYLYTLRPKITGFTINESVDRKNEYLDKVVNFLVDDTKLDDIQEELTIYLGSAGFKIIYFSDFLWTTAYFLHDIPSYFSGYCKNTYGLTDEEIRYVWKKYRYIIRDKILSIMKNKYRSNNINESVDRKSEYLDKIVDFMLNDTRYSVYTNRYYVHSKVAADIWFPSDSDNGYTYTKDEIHEWTNDYEWYFDGGDIEYICETYSICDRDTIQEMYNRYIQKLSTIIYDEMLEVERRNDSINESVDRKEKLINKIVKFILDDIKNS